MLKLIVAMEAGTSVVVRDLGSARSGRGSPRLEVDRNRLDFLRGLNFTINIGLKARCINVRRLQLCESIRRVRGPIHLAPCIERTS